MKDVMSLSGRALLDLFEETSLKLYAIARDTCTDCTPDDFAKEYETRSKCEFELLRRLELNGGNK